MADWLMAYDWVFKIVFVVCLFLLWSGRPKARERRERRFDEVFASSILRRQPEDDARLARVLLASPDARHYGFETSRRAAVPPAPMYRFFDRAMTNGWVVDGWDEPPVERPARRYYRLTSDGREALMRLVSEAS